MNSTTEQHEEYIHLESSIDDLNRAWIILNEILKPTIGLLVISAFQFAIIEYAKPYLKARGKLRDYKLDDSCVPSEHKNLHQKLLKMRNTIIAHSDLTIRDAHLHVVDMPSGRFVGTAQNVIVAWEEISNIETIIDLIERTLECLYKREQRLKVDLPTTR